MMEQQDKRTLSPCMTLWSRATLPGLQTAHLWTLCEREMKIYLVSAPKLRVSLL